MDLGVRHDTHCEKYNKRSDTNGEKVGVLLSHSYQPAVVCTALNTMMDKINTFHVHFIKSMHI